jgi:hypothetical protein
MWGTVRRNPHTDPDEASIALFGPGVPAIDTANANADANHAALAAATGTIGENPTTEIMAHTMLLSPASGHPVAKERERNRIRRIGVWNPQPMGMPHLSPRRAR